MFVVDWLWVVGDYSWGWLFSWCVRITFRLKFNSFIVFNFAPWLVDSVSHKEHLTLLCLVLTHPGSELRTVIFVCFLIRLGTFWPNLGFFYQPDGLVGNWFNRFSTIVGWLCQSRGTLDLALFGSHSSRLRIENRFFCLLPYSFRNFLTKSWLFYQPAEPVQHHGWLTLSVMRNTWPCFVWFSLV